MTQPAMGLPRARSGHDQVVVRAVGDELVVYDLQRGRFHALNATAANLWRWSDGNTSAEEMARRLAEQQSLDADRSRSMVEVGLRRLHRAGLLDGSAPLMEGRREALRKVARLAMAPAVASLLAPTRVAAVSVCGFCGCLTAGHPCSSTGGLNHRACRNTTTGSCTCRRFLCFPAELFCGTC